MSIWIYVTFSGLLILLFYCISNISKAHRSCNYPAESKYIVRTLIVIAIITVYTIFLKFILKI